MGAHVQSSTPAQWVRNNPTMRLNWIFGRERTGEGGGVTAHVILQKGFTKRKWVPTGCRPSPSARQPVLPPGEQQTARQLQGARAGEGTHLWEPPVARIASTSATNLMCDLQKATLQIPFGLLFIAEDCLALWVQPEAFLDPMTDQRRKALNWTLLSALQFPLKPSRHTVVHRTTYTDAKSGRNENARSPPRISAGIWDTLAEIQLSWH